MPGRLPSDFRDVDRRDYHSLIARTYEHLRAKVILVTLLGLVYCLVPLADLVSWSMGAWIMRGVDDGAAAGHGRPGSH